VFDDSNDPAIGPYRLITELLAGGGYEKAREFGKMTALRSR
jgi:hypothetical protein